MKGSEVFKRDSGREAEGLASLLMRCMGIGLQQLCKGEEARKRARKASQSYIVCI